MPKGWNIIMNKKQINHSLDVISQAAHGAESSLSLGSDEIGKMLEAGKPAVKALEGLILQECIDCNVITGRQVKKTTDDDSEKNRAYKMSVSPPLILAIRTMFQRVSVADGEQPYTFHMGTDGKTGIANVCHIQRAVEHVNTKKGKKDIDRTPTTLEELLGKAVRLHGITKCQLYMAQLVVVAASKAAEEDDYDAVEEDSGE